MKTARKNSTQEITIESFIMELSLIRSKLTVEAYSYDVAKFLEFMQDRNIKRLKSIKAEHVTIYLGQNKTAGKSDSTIKRYYNSIKAFFNYLKRMKVIDEDITANLKTPRAMQKSPRVPSLSEIDLILTRPNVDTEAGARDRAILELLYSSGLRASELCDLTIGDVEAGQVLVQCGKGNKTRTIPMTSSAKYFVSLYKSKYREDSERDEYLFITMYGRKLRRQFLSTMVSQYAKEAKIDGITTHSLRHACATHLLDHGADLRLIQEVLGHASLASTQRYTHLSSNKMKQMFDQFHPRKEIHHVTTTL